MRQQFSTVFLLLAVATGMSGCGGGGGSSDSGVPKGHSVNKTVSFADRYGKTTITVESAGTADSIFKDLVGDPIEADIGEFVFVTFSKFESPILRPDDLLELKGSDGKLYTSRLTNGPDSGGAIAGLDEADPNHFTEAFDLPKDVIAGAVLIIRENGTDRDLLEHGSRVGRKPPPGYAVGAHEVDLGL